jgi:hypothetical protein
MSKNDIHAKKSILGTTKNWLNIFEKSFIQIDAMDDIYHLYKKKKQL